MRPERRRSRRSRRPASCHPFEVVRVANERFGEVILILERVAGLNFMPKSEFTSGELREAGEKPQSDGFEIIDGYGVGTKPTCRFQSRVEGGFPLDDDLAMAESCRKSTLWHSLIP